MTPNLPDTLEWLPIEGLEPAGQAECVCISVDHASRCYVTGMGIVTHNSDTKSAAEDLPPHPKAFLERLLDGASPEEAAKALGAGADRGEAIARNIGRFLANRWHQTGTDADSALRELQEIAHARQASRGPVVVGPSAPVKDVNPLARASFNHVDRWLTQQAGAIVEKVKDSKAGDALDRTLAKMTGVADRYIPFFAKTREALHRQALPMEHVPQEVKSLLREMQWKTAFGQQTALDLGRAATGKAKFTDLAYPQGFSGNPAARKKLFLAMDSKLPGGPRLEDLPADQQRLAAYLRELRADVGREAVRVGRLSADTMLEMEDSMPHYYEQDQGEKSLSARARRLLGLQDIKAQRATAWHIVDTQTKDPRSPGEHALVAMDPQGRRWRFNSAEHRDAFYADFIRDKALDYLTHGDERELTHMLAALPSSEKSRVRAQVKSLTAEMMDRREELPPEVRGIINQATNRMRQRFLKKAPLDIEAHEKAGLMFDPIYATMRHVAQMTHDNAVAEFFNHIAANHAWSSDTPAPGFKQIPDTRSYGKLAGKYVADAIADQVMAVAGQESPAMELYDDLMRAWSSGKTVWNPGTHARNFLGNFLFAALAGNSIHNPANWGFYRDAARVIRDGGDRLKEMYEHGVLGGDYSTAELKGALKQMLPDPSLSEDGEPPSRLMARVGAALFATLPHKLRNGLERTSAFANGVYKVTDDFFKAAGYLKARAMGMSAEEAAAHTRKWYPYYDHIGSSSGIKFARRVHPFLSFGLESARILKNATLERPLLLASSMIMPYVATQIAMNLLGINADDDRQQVLKDMRGKLKFKGMTGEWPAFAMLLPLRWQGKLQQFDLSNIAPFAALLGRPLDTAHDEPFAQTVAKQLLGGPLGSIVGGFAFNQDPFNGRHITEEDMSPAEDAMARAKYVWNILAPPLLPGASGYDTVAAATERSTNKTLEKRNLGQAVLRAVLGLDVRNASPDVYRLAEEFRKAHGIPAEPEFNGGSTATQRDRAALFAQLAQDEPDIDKVADILTRLDAAGAASQANPLGPKVPTVRSAQDIHRLLFYRNPLFVMHGKDAQTQFRYGLTGEARDVLEDALTEYHRIEAKAPAVINAARQRMIEKAQ